ncbi:efflux RND transporter periplasmic adaptor subunit [Clostridium tarantellae]|uniref:Efflux RND transporter periplasmic adaptor subunit n=1 Tax=Clostridium tarantellae TaxID=39493 RepID=A0A6I1MNE7_9CLOT|nr:efflux RND transporter periplasmic adaptor subunit [Clostridium tarantellae]MPQ42431.1 efflux RND transporter periplasmic adaptor subunit [Clostridium tarantellae]
MNRKKKTIIISLVTAGIILASSTGFYFLKKNMNGEKKVASLETYTIPTSDKVFINGVVAPEKVETIYLEPAKGTVNKVKVNNGQNVDKDDELFIYKNDAISTQIEQLEGQLSTMKNEKKQIINKQNAVNKQTKSLLGEKAPEINIPQTANMTSPKISTEGIDEQIKALEKQIKNLKNKEYTTIKSPISGKVILHEGDKNPMSPYITIESLNYYVNGNVSEKDQHKLKENQIVDITVLSTNTDLKGKIKSVGDRPVSSPMPTGLEGATGGSANSNMSYYLVNINLDEQGKATNGFHVQATVNLEAQPIKIPKTAIVKDENGDYVFKSIDKKLVKQPITYSEENETDKVIVSNGLGENDEVITNVNGDLKEGMSVE